MVELTENIDIIVKMQNIQLLKFIAFKENWNFVELCKEYL